MSRLLFQLRSLKTRVALFTLVIFLISLWSMAFYASTMLRVDMQRQLGEQQFATTSFVAMTINQEVDDRLSALEIVAREIEPSLLGDTPALQTFLEKKPIFQRLFNAGTFVTRLDGTATASLPLSAERKGVSYMDRDFVIAALKAGKTTVGRPVTGKKLLAPVSVMAAPIRDAHGAVIGVLAGVTNLGMPSFLDKIAEGHYGKSGGYLLIAPRHNVFVTATDKSRILNRCTQGAGSTFRFSVTLRKSDKAATLQPATDVDAEAAIQLRYAGHRILVADDEPMNREIVQMLLEGVGLVVDTAEDGAEAIALARQTDYAAIFMDMQMPRVNGLEATQRICELPGYSDRPIIAMTANAFAEDKARCLEAGMSDFLLKPFDPDTLFSTLLRGLGQRHHGQEKA
jgi:CheY-like chemotaxis protein